MTRKTVTVSRPGNRAPQTFHLSEDRAERFAAKMQAKGATVTVGRFAPSPELVATLRRAGVK